MPDALYRLVIDASVLRAAGETEDVTSTACRTFLGKMQKTSHLAVLSDELEDEWNRHASQLSNLWRTNLESQDRIVALDSCRDDLLAGQVSTALPSDLSRIAAKDLHLVIAALATDRIVVSLDDKARRAFVAACPRIPQFRNIRWVNPVTDGATLIPWLRGEAEAPRHWNLNPSRESA